MTRTLNAFKWLLRKGEHTIHCPHVSITEWTDGMPPLFEGSGRFILKDDGDINFELDVKCTGTTKWMSALRRCQEEPYDPQSALRLCGTDYQGTDWNAGWTRPRTGSIWNDHMQLFGECMGLSTQIHQEEPQSGVELAYSPAPDVPFSEVMTTTAHLGDFWLGTKRGGGRQRLELLGSVVEAVTEPWTGELWLYASASEHLRHPYLENWLSEPLRALHGQLVFPRLVARNFGDGRAAVWVRRVPKWRTSMGGCASQLKYRSPTEFWAFYGRYLEYIALHRDKNGDPGFEANELTRLHDEVIQARMAGSTWVIALCVASAIEGIVKLDPDFGSAAPEVAEAQLLRARNLALGLEIGPVRNRLLNSLNGLSQASPRQYLKDLEKCGKITKSQFDAWDKVRNVVAHGNLFEPWETPEERKRLTALVELFYRLTGIRIGYFA